MKLDWFLDAVVAVVVLFNLLLSPYTKVEESFNMQAIHDILNYGVHPPSVLESYDHKSFPGAVPRTFVGSLVISGVLKTFDFFYSLVSGTSFIADGPLGGQLHVQLIARAVLGLANVYGLVTLRRSLTRISSSRGIASSVGLFYTILISSQFHLMFYASRSLPNFVVLPLVNFALSKLVVGNLSGLTWLAFAGVIFRLEVGLFAAVIAIVSSLVFGQSNIFQGAFMLAAGSVVGLATTYFIDTYFWGVSTIPELQAFYFNVVAGKSAQWGVEPFMAYFNKYIPNFFRPPHVYVLFLLGLFVDPIGKSEPFSNKNGSSTVVNHPAKNSLRILAVSSILFVLAMSIQPHKEWRFIVYTIPPVILIAANGFAYLWERLSVSLAHKLLMIVMIGSALTSCLIATLMSFASSYNYPGGAAISYVNQIIAELPGNNILVHMDVPACMTGITKFTELHNPHVIFDKTENEHELAKIWNDVNYLITHKNMNEPLMSDLIVYNSEHWNHLSSVKIFYGVNLARAMQNLQLLSTDQKFRTNFLNSVWTELQQGIFKTFVSTLEESIVLVDYLHIYQRVAPDDMPAILDFGDVEKPSKKAFTNEADEGNEINELEINPEDIQESINEQIDQIEEGLASTILDEEL